MESGLHNKGSGFPDESGFRHVVTQQGSRFGRSARGACAPRALACENAFAPHPPTPLPGVPGRGFNCLVGSTEHQYRHGARALSSSKNRPPPEWFFALQVASAQGVVERLVVAWVMVWKSFFDHLWEVAARLAAEGRGGPSAAKPEPNWND